MSNSKEKIVNKRGKFLQNAGRKLLKRAGAVCLTSALIVSSICSSIAVNAYGNVSRDVPEVTQQEGWLCAPSSVAAVLKYINQIYLSAYNPNINSRSYQVSMGSSVGTGDPNDNSPSYGGDDTMMKNYLNNNQTYRSTPHPYDAYYIGTISNFLTKMYNALNNSSPPILHVKCSTAVFGYYTSTSHFMPAYAISGASSSPSGSDTVGVVDPYRKRNNSSLSPKTTYTAQELYDATMDIVI